MDEYIRKSDAIEEICKACAKHDEKLCLCEAVNAIVKMEGICQDKTI